MSEKTKIEWADGTFNPWIGCTKVSPGCAHCYAEMTTRARVLRKRGQETWGKGAKRSRTSAATWKKPVMWNKAARISLLAWEKMKEDHDVTEEKLIECGHIRPAAPRIFPSLCDWLDEEVPVEWLADFLKLIFETPNLDWLLLTKRPENFLDRLAQVAVGAVSNTDPKERESFRVAGDFAHGWAIKKNAPKNVWLGTSVEDQQRADERIPALLKIPARVRFLSVEPMLSEINLRFTNDDLRGDGTAARQSNIVNRILPDWVIFGGESGPGARACNVEWIRSGEKQ